MKKFLPLFLFLFVAAVRAGEPVAEIKAVLAAQTDAWNRGDLDGFMRAYWRSDELRFTSDGTVTRGWKSTLKRYKKRYPEKAAMGALTFTIQEVTVLAPDAAVVFGKWELAREQGHPWGWFTLTLRQLPEGWRIVADHTSSAEK